jgi:hypothetical protein
LDGDGSTANKKERKERKDRNSFEEIDRIKNLKRPEGVARPQMRRFKSTSQLC